MVQQLADAGPYAREAEKMIDRSLCQAAPAPGHPDREPLCRLPASEGREFESLSSLAFRIAPFKCRGLLILAMNPYRGPK